MMKISGLSFIIFLAISNTAIAESTRNCDAVESRVDDFTGEISINSPLTKFDGDIYATILKVKAKNQKTTYLRLATKDEFLSIDGDDAYVLFEDGSKWHKKTKIEVSAKEDGFQYVAFFRLSQNELQKLKTNKISKFKLDVFEQMITDDESEQLRIHVGCIMNM